jgi:hypothetical protein
VNSEVILGEICFIATKFIKLQKQRSALEEKISYLEIIYKGLQARADLSAIEKEPTTNHAAIENLTRIIKSARIPKKYDSTQPKEISFKIISIRKKLSNISRRSVNWHLANAEKLRILGEKIKYSVTVGHRKIYITPNGKAMYNNLTEEKIFKRAEEHIFMRAFEKELMKATS